MFLNEDELFFLGFKSIGLGVKISDKASLYNTKNISIGDYSRIDDFAILSAGDGGIEIGKYVHIACHTSLIGQGKITMEDYSGISSRVAIYSSSDPYDGTWMTNPTLPHHVTNTKHAPVKLGKHVVVGTGSTILPGVELYHCSIGAMSLVNKSFYGPYILIGIPAKPVKQRSNNIWELEKQI
jgi:dTDP-4-amino-4,6-dideoxy-D-glucose acyltransferase